MSGIPELTSLLIDSKEQFITRITEVVLPFVIRTLDEIQCEAGKNVTWTRGQSYQFQKLLKNVPKWNQDIIMTKTNEIISYVPWFNDLIAAALVTQTKVLSSIRLSSDMPDVKLKIPSSQDFVGTLYTEIARHLYYNPNYSVNDLDKIIFDAVERAIRKMIPFKDILESYLSSPPDGDAENLNDNDSGSTSSSSDSSSSDDDDDDGDNGGDGDDGDYGGGGGGDGDYGIQSDLNIDIAPPAAPVAPPVAPVTPPFAPVASPVAPPFAPVASPVVPPEFDESDDQRVGALPAGHSRPVSEPVPTPPSPSQLFATTHTPQKLTL